jgi:ABC transport system ATP-binding/permease protein
MLEVIIDGGRWTFAPTGPVVLGRDLEADLPLDHRSVSRRHAVLSPTPSGWTLTDLSRNGTFVDGQPVARRQLARQTVAHLGVPRTAFG